MGVLCNDGEGATDFLLLVFNNVEQVHRDDGIDLNEDDLTDAGGVQVERIIARNIEGEILRANLKPVWRRGFKREVAVGPRNGACRETACALTSVFAIRAVADGQEEVLEDLARTTDLLHGAGVKDGVKHAIERVTTDDRVAEST